MLLALVVAASAALRVEPFLGSLPALLTPIQVLAASEPFLGQDSDLERHVLRAFLEDWGHSSFTKEALGQRMQEWGDYLERWRAKMVEQLLGLLGYEDRDEQFKDMVRASPEAYFLTFETYRALVH